MNWNPMVAQYSDWMSSSGFQKVWEIRKHTYNPDFQKFVDELTFGDYKLSQGKKTFLSYGRNNKYEKIHRNG